MNNITSMPHPLRLIGVARVLAGAGFVYTGISELLQYPFLVPQAARLFGDRGSTDAPLRALLTLSTAAIEVVVGLVLVVLSIKWLRSLRLPAGGPAPIAAEEVAAVLSTRQAPAFGEGRSRPHWLLRGPMSDQVDDAPWWDREIMSAGARAFARSWLLVAVIATSYLLVRLVNVAKILGPFPIAFIVVLVAVTGMWSVLGLMLIPSHGPRVESMKIPFSELAATHRVLHPGEVIESAPNLLHRNSSALGITLGVVGVATQCALLAWWNLSLVGFPLMATSILRHTGSIIGGILFFVLGWRIVLAAATLLLRFRYESTLVWVDPEEPAVALAAAIRSESLGVNGPRHITAAVASSQVRDAVHLLVVGDSR